MHFGMTFPTSYKCDDSFNTKLHLGNATLMGIDPRTSYSQKSTLPLTMRVPSLHNIPIEFTVEYNNLPVFINRPTSNNFSHRPKTLDSCIHQKCAKVTHVKFSSQIKEGKGQMGTSSICFLCRLDIYFYMNRLKVIKSASS